jgi:preprotein translocase subunit Sss1
MNAEDLKKFVTESNRIEGIHREPTDEELQATRSFLGLGRLTVGAVYDLVSVYAPGANLRRHAGMNVQVGNHLPLRGGPEVERRLIDLLDAINDQRLTPHAAHVQYETLHPFMDGNGRSGRAVWLWQMREAPLGFLHQFYYQTLAACEQRWSHDHDQG